MEYISIIKQVMILDPNDPTGLGLFSKCARNQASKLKPHRPATAGRGKSKPVQEDQSRKKSNTHCSFERQQSRDQRERKYHREETPPVGKYNPNYSFKPKMVWDILKVYSRNEKKHTVPTLTTQLKDTVKEKSQSYRQQTQQAYMTLNSKVQASATSFNHKQETSSMTSIGKSQCMVNMSRMTGRKEEQFQSQDWGEIDVMKSVGFVKGTITKNICIAKQFKEKPKRYGTINPASNYVYDYTCIKPRRRGLVNFAIGRGRDQKLKTQLEYSYQHYDYDSYVWSNKSRVYPNTKTHLIQFNKQMNRYRDTDRAQLEER